ncbi:MAG: hypothetical protein HYW33_02090 [Candidatus Blackburnbacteria bacterium]|nr:hypothetical protein [Candidatus Blackburnbacteria bacterium]
MRAQAAVELGGRAFQVANAASSGFSQKTVAPNKLTRAAKKVAQELSSTQLVLIIAAKAKRPLLSKQIGTLDDLVNFVAEILEAYAWESMHGNGYEFSDRRARNRFEKVETKNARPRKAARTDQARWAYVTEEQTREEIRHLLD